MLLERVHVELEARLDIRYFVFVDDVALGQLIDHRKESRDLLLRVLFLFGAANIAKRIAHRLVVILVVFASFFAAANSFQC